MWEELIQAIDDLYYKQKQYFYAEHEFEEAAWRGLQAAQEKVNALIRKAERKGDEYAKSMEKMEEPL